MTPRTPTAIATAVPGSEARAVLKELEDDEEEESLTAPCEASVLKESHFRRVRSGGRDTQPVGPPRE